ncbi:hypothetical protein GNF80_15005 [Clostridium perfringens]|nr:hypothetical protein [Clostridium perfringens]
MKVEKLNELKNNSKRIVFNNDSKIVFFSDCHRGDGTYKDSLAPNINIYLTALRYYYKNKFTYIEVGDGDELWKFKNLQEIYDMNHDVYEVLDDFKEKNKLYMIYGNHDRDKSKIKFLRKSKKRNRRNHSACDFYSTLPIYESLVLVHEESKKDFFILHGHQVDFLNNELAFLSKFLVRYVWAILEAFMGFKDPISPAKSDNKRDKFDEKIINWAEENNTRVVLGHTHKTLFPRSKRDSTYFNIGCCVLPRTVTAIEVERGEIALVKWTIKVDQKGSLFIGRDIIGGPTKIENY